jgi:integrase
MLTDPACRNARVKDGKALILTDEGGLQLRVAPTGAKSWRWRRIEDGKERLTTLGRYPAMSLAQARAARDKLRDFGPEVPAETLRDVTARWLARQTPLWKPHHAADVKANLDREIMKDLGDKPLHKITASMIVATLTKVEQRGAVELAHRLRQRLAAVWVFAIAGGAQLTHNPAAGIGKALQPVVRGGHRAAVTGLAEAREALQRAEAVPAHPVTRLALRLLALTAVRPGELRGATWGEFQLSGDLGQLAWTIPAARMKHIKERAASTPDHAVPLSRQAVEVLQAAHTLTGRLDLVFPSVVDSRAPMSENALGYLMNRAGYAGRQTAHGWRATFSSVMNERNPADRDVIEAMLAHMPRDSVHAAYNRTLYAARRRDIAQEWANLLLHGARPAVELLDGRRRSKPGLSD